jgi:hypothetical protein
MSTNDATMRERIRDLLQSRQLPVYCPDRVWGGFGTGQERCAVCDEMVGARQGLIEVESSGAHGSSLYFHARCFWPLESEWRPLEHASVSRAGSSNPGAAADAEPGHEQRSG